MDNNNNVYIGTLHVITDARKLERIALTCRCGHRWTERVPGELHDSDVTFVFACICGQVYHLRNHRLQRVKEDAYANDGQQRQTDHYDA